MNIKIIANPNELNVTSKLRERHAYQAQHHWEAATVILVRDERIPRGYPVVIIDGGRLEA